MLRKSHTELVTRTIIERTANLPLHIRSDPSDEWVSSESQWKSTVWRLDVENGNRLAGAIHWDLELDDGSRLTSLRHARLLNSLKRFVWSLIVDNRHGKLMKVSGVSTWSTSIRRLAYWMVLKYHKDFSTLDREAFREFLDFCMQKLQENEEELEDELASLNGAGVAEDGIAAQNNRLDGEVNEDSSSGAGLYKCIRIWSLIWTQSEPLKGGGVAAMKQDPLGGDTARAVFVKHIAVLIKRIPPLPDEVALPILNEAHRWLRYRSDDIIRLHEYYMDLILNFSNEDDDGPVVLTADQADTVEPFKFSCEPNSNLPWHQPIEVIHRIHGITRRRNFYTLDTLEVRGLVDALWGACVIVIQAESGMRPGEVVATPSGHDAERDEHVALLIEESISGLHEIFYVKSLLGKTVDVPDRQKWVIGARPIGSHFLPGPYLAIKALERLLQPWRDMSDDKEVKDQLLIHQGNGSALPKKKRSISVATTTKLLSAQKLFIERHVDLSDLPDRSDLGENLCRYRETKGRCFIAQQWRKTYAMYTVRTDRRMIPDIAMQFKHLSVAMTESAYIGNDVSLMREVNSQQARQAAALMYRRIRGTTPTTGRLAKIIDEYSEAIIEIIGERSGTEAITHLAEWCEERGIKVFSSGQGKCAIGLYPSEARCHELAGTVHWSRKAPNFSYREPDVCNGCKCFGIDSDHVDFWENRYVENQTAYLKAKAKGLTAGFLAIRERAQVSLRVCKALGRKVPTVRIS